MPTPPFFHPAGVSEPAAALHHVQELQDRTRADLGSFWFPLVVFGVLTLASIPFLVPDGSPAIPYFWAVAGPAGGAAIGWYYHSREQRLGVSRSGTPFLVTGAVLFVAAFGLPAVTTGALQEVVSAFAVGAGYLVFAWLSRSPTLAVLGVVVAAVPAGALLVGLAHPGPPVAATTGSAILVTGLAARRAEQRSA